MGVKNLAQDVSAALSGELQKWVPKETFRQNLLSFEKLTVLQLKAVFFSKKVKKNPQFSVTLYVENYFVKPKITFSPIPAFKNFSENFRPILDASLLIPG